MGGVGSENHIYLHICTLYIPTHIYSLHIPTHIHIPTHMHIPTHIHIPTHTHTHTSPPLQYTQATQMHCIGTWGEVSLRDALELALGGCAQLQPAVRGVVLSALQARGDA